MRVTDIQIHRYTHTQTDYRMPSAHAHRGIISNFANVPFLSGDEIGQLHLQQHPPFSGEREKSMYECFESDANLTTVYTVCTYVHISHHKSHIVHILYRERLDIKH